MANFCYLWLYTPTPAACTSVVQGVLQRRISACGRLATAVQVRGWLQRRVRSCGVLRGVTKVDGQLARRCKIVERRAVHDWRM